MMPNKTVQSQKQHEKEEIKSGPEQLPTDSLYSPLIPKTKQPKKFFTFKEALIEVTKLAGPIFASHFCGLCYPLFVGFILGNSTNKIHRLSFGITEVVINAILTAINASQATTQIIVSKQEGFINKIKKDLTEDLVNIQAVLDKFKKEHQPVDYSYQKKLINHFKKLLNQTLEKTEMGLDEFHEENENEDEEIEQEIKKIIIASLKNSKKSLTDILQQAGMQEKIEPTWIDLCRKLQVFLNKNSMDTDEKDDSPYPLLPIEKLHLSIIQEGRANTGSYIKAGMFYAQTLQFLILPLLLSIKQILLMVGIEREIAEEIRNFLGHITWGLTAIVGMLANREVFNALQYKWLALALAAFNMLSSGILGSILFYFFEMGSAGLSIAFSSGAWMTFIIGLTILFCHPSFHEFQLFSNKGNFKKNWLETFHIGVKVLFMAIPDYLLLTVLMILVSLYSEKFDIPAYVAQGAFGLYNLLITFAMGLGIADALINLINRAVSEKNGQKLWQYTKVNIAMNTMLTLFITTLFLGFPETLFSAFCLVKECPTDEINEYVKLLFWGVASSAADVGTLGSKAALAGLGDFNPSMAMSTVYVLGLGLLLQIAVGMKQDMSPAELHLLRFVSLLPSLIGHVTRAGVQTTEAIKVLNEEVSNRIDTETNYESLSPNSVYETDDDVESTSCLQKVMARGGKIVKGLSQFVGFGFFSPGFRERYNQENTSVTVIEEPDSVVIAPSGSIQ